MLVAKSDQGGNITIQKLTDHHTRRGLKWGIVAGVVAGIVFPPSILASAVVLGTAGAAVGKIGNVRQKAKVEKAVADVLTPGTSGILALIDAGGPAGRQGDHAPGRRRSRPSRSTTRPPTAIEKAARPTPASRS